MKIDKILLVVILIFGLFMLFILTGCNSSNAKEERFILIADDGLYGCCVYYDKETKVEYVSLNNGHGGTPLTLLVDREGKPLLYNGD